MSVTNYRRALTADQQEKFQYIQELREQGKSWRVIADILGLKHPGPMNFFKKCRKRIYESSIVPEKKTEKALPLHISVFPKSTIEKDSLFFSQLPGINSSMKSKNDKASEIPAWCNHEGYYNIARLPKYGQLEPTGFISPLDNDDWINYYGGEGYSWKKEYLTEMRTFLVTTNKGIVFDPRGHGKTKSTVPLKSRKVLEKNNAVLIITSGPNAKRKIFKEIKRILTSDRVRRDYGDMFESFNQQTTEIWYKKSLQRRLDPPTKVSGRLEDIIGSHPDDIHLEDIIQEEFKSDESNESLRDWFSDVVKFCANETTTFTATATRKAPDDFYGWLIATHHWEVLHKRAIELVSGRWPNVDDLVKEIYDDGSGLLRERIVDIKLTGEFKTLDCPNWSLKRLLTAKVLDSKGFESQMQNNPLPASGLYFNEDDFVVIDHTKYNANDYRDFYIFVDPAYGRSNKADNTSILVICVIPPKLVIVDGIIDKLTWTELEAHTERFLNKYKPHILHIEENFFQIWILQNTKAKGWPIYGIKQTKNKIMRIAATKVHWIEKRIEILKSYPGREKLYTEYLLFDEKPSTSSKHDDGLDTVAMACEHLSQYVRTEGISWFS